MHLRAEKMFDRPAQLAQFGEKPDDSGAVSGAALPGLGSDCCIPCP